MSTCFRDQGTVLPRWRQQGHARACDRRL